MTARGATPDQWGQWVRLAPLDVLPIVSDPTTPGYNSTKDGKRPSVVRNGYVSGITAWQNMKREPEQWSKDGRLSIGCQSRTIRFIDIDLEDSDDVLDLIHDVMGELPMRWREGTGKCALAYRIKNPPEVLRKGIVAIGDEKVEFLGDGQQALVAGWHPKGMLHWDGLPASVDSIPEFEIEQVVALYDKLKEKFGDSRTKKWGYSGTLFRKDDSYKVDPKDKFWKWLDDRGMVLGASPDGKVFIDCPVCKTTPGTTPITKDSAAYFPKGARGEGREGFSCFKGRHDRLTLTDLQEILGYRAEVITEAFERLTPINTAAESRPKLKTDKRGVLPSLPNINAMIGWKEGIEREFKFDIFLSEGLIKLKDEEWRPLQDNDINEITLRLHEMGIEASISKQHVRDAVQMVSMRNKFDSALEYVESIKWDGISRLRDFVEKCLGIEATEYHMEAAKYIWTALAGRVLSPGLKADMVPIFLGKQGNRKSTLVKWMAPTPKQYSSINLTQVATHSDDLARKIRGVLLAEWAEVKGLATADDDAIKEWLTLDEDEWVPKYMEHKTVAKRRFLLIGTTNRKALFKDPTGDRRYLPIVIGNFINTNWMKENKDQLWAEGAVLFREHGLIFEQAERLAAYECRKFRRWSPWRHVVMRWIAKRAASGKPFTLDDILQGAVGISTKYQTGRVTHEMRDLLTAMRWEEDADGFWFYTDDII